MEFPRSWRPARKKQVGSIAGSFDQATPTFRRVVLPEVIPGGLFLTSAPSDYARFLRELDRERIDRIACLCSIESIKGGSLDYAKALSQTTLADREVDLFPITDGGIPEDLNAFQERVSHWSALLRQGENLLVHCSAGIGRTGMVAICILLALSVDLDESRRVVDNAGSGPETPLQNLFIEGFQEKKN